MNKLEELAERCERATGPDRELDGDIHAMLGGGQRRRALEELGVFGPEYTRSIDAAMSLVPEWWTRGLITWPGYDNGKLLANANAELHHALSSGGGPKVEGYAATPALALAAASLRARSMKEGSHGEG